MAISYQILKDKRLVIVTTSGETNLSETIQFFEQMYADPEYSMEYDLLWDDTERTTIFTYYDMRKLAQHFKHYRGDKHPKRAIVVSRGDNYGISRFFKMMRSIGTQTQIGLFPDIAEALKWLEH